MKTKLPETSLTQMLKASRPGDSFLTFRTDRHVTSYAARFNMQVKTRKARMVVKGEDRLINVVWVTVVTAAARPEPKARDPRRGRTK